MPNRSFLIPALYFLFTPLLLPAQSGCTDPAALNYDPAATTNDGSCEYSPTSYQPAHLADLTETLDEISGLAFINDQLWAQTDSYNPQKLYRLHTTTGLPEHETLLVSSSNTDWEDLARDDNYLYVGDFGNNDGDRSDLKIYKVPINQLSQNAATTEVIAFQYEDQTSFEPAPAQNNFDCEAFFFANDSLHLFTKRWLDQKTYHYVLPAEAGSYVAQLRDSFDTEALITAADIDAQGHIILLGLAPITQEAVLWLLYDYPEGHFFAGNKRRISLGSPFVNGQLEGICFSGIWEGYLAAERFGQLPPQLQSFQIGDIVSSTENPTGKELGQKSTDSIRAWPNPFTESITLESYKQLYISEIKLFDGSKKAILMKQWPVAQKLPLTLETPSHLPKGIYYLSVKTKSGKEEMLRLVK